MFCFLWFNAFYHLKFVGPHESGNCTIVVQTKQHVFLLLDAVCYANGGGAAGAVAFTPGQLYDGR